MQKVSKSKDNDRELRALIEITASLSSKKIGNLEQLMAKLHKNGISGYKIYESILQTYLFCGFPAAIKGLQEFSKYYKISISKENYNLKIFRTRGLAAIKKVYDKNHVKLIENFSNMSPDLADWMIIEGYGKVLARPKISLKIRELLNVAILCTNYYETQLISHIKGSLNTGSNKEEIENVIKQTAKFNNKKNITKALKLLKTC